MLHHADHELQNLRVFCPQHYFHGWLPTWNAPQLSTTLQNHFRTARETSTLPHHVLPRTPPQSLPMGFSRKHFHIPHDVVFLKAKTTDRVEERQNGYQLLLQLLITSNPSREFSCVVPQKGKLSIPTFWQQLHVHFHHGLEDIHLAAINGDLVGPLADQRFLLSRQSTPYSL